MINQLYVTIAQESEHELVEELDLSQLQNPLGNKAPSNNEIIDQHSESQNAEEESEYSSEDEEEDVVAANAGLESKLLFIRETEQEDPSMRRFKVTLNFTFAILIALMSCALIASNVLTNPLKHFEFLDHLDDQAILINDIIGTTRNMFFEQLSDSIIANFTNTTGAHRFWPCALGQPYTPPGQETLETCEFMTNFDPVERLRSETERLYEAQKWLANNYPLIRSPGDQIDEIYNHPFTYSEYTNGPFAPATSAQISGWVDFVGTKVLDAISKLISQPIIDGTAQSRLDFAFIQTNRNLMVSKIQALQSATVQRMGDIITVEASLHLAITLILIGLLAISFFVFMIPRIRQIQSDRLLVLKLLLLIPKSVVWDFVYRIYRDDSEDDMNEDADGSRELDGNEQNEQKAKALRLHSEESVEIINDNAYGLYLFFGLLMLSITLPSIVHVAWKYSFNTTFRTNLENYQSALLLLSSFNSLLWRSTGLWGVCDFRRPRDYAFCASLKATAAQIRTAADQVPSFF